jgi:hypothetical protein
MSLGLQRLILLVVAFLASGGSGLLIISLAKHLQRGDETGSSKKPGHESPK